MRTDVEALPPRAAQALVTIRRATDPSSFLRGFLPHGVRESIGSQVAADSGALVAGIAGFLAMA